jgi:MarR family transcriptional regulator, negative regulator of the multidrug operon emrRAB
MPHISHRLENLLGAVSVAVMDRNPQNPNSAALVSLYWNDGLSVDNLARIVLLSQPGTVRLVDRLVAAGLVRRATSHTDRRVRLLHLTARGKHRCEQILSERTTQLASVVADLDPETARSLEYALEIVLGRLTMDTTSSCQICRLCDETACGAPTNCPVDQALERLP